ncbi:MAG: NAD(P)/FAD-dependent oxidoreductase [Chthoniobacterales bacterium]
MKTNVAIIGAGPAGLTAAYLLSKNDVSVTVLEADPVYVGGISRTATYKGFHFDIGGHRFFSKSKEVNDLWDELLPDDMLERPRSSRIFYGGKFFAYPLKPFEALVKLGPVRSLLCVLSWLKARLFPVRDPRNFQDWVSNQFGKRLFNTFFKSYTEKVWGMSCKEISADWAAQRIKGLSLGSAIKNALFPQRQPKDSSKVIKSLINSFKYPRRGPGMMWEACAEKTRALGGNIEMGCRVTGCEYDEDSGTWTTTYRDNRGVEHKLESEHVISSAPMRELVNGLAPAVSDKAKRAANSLKYRDFLTVMLILKNRDAFHDNWIYIHDPSVKVGRIQNFRSWSPEMVPDADKACYGLEYFCFEHDGLWDASDAELIELAKRELIQIGLACEGDVLDGTIVRQKKAYPVYDDDYARHVAVVRDELETRYPNLHLVGRNGMHKYNNQDHAMMTAMLCAENIMANTRLYDLWQVNGDAEYHEGGSAAAEETVGSAIRLVPARVGAPQLAPES